MPGRIAIATLSGLLFLAGWLAGATVLADHVFRLNMAIQFTYFAIAGFAWVFPIRWLMLWAAGLR